MNPPLNTTSMTKQMRERCTVSRSVQYGSQKWIIKQRSKRRMPMPFNKPLHMLSWVRVVFVFTIPNHWQHTGATLLAKEGWKAWGKYQVLSFDIHKLCLDLQVLTGSYSAADATYALLLPHATSLQAKTDVYIAVFHRFELEVRMSEEVGGGWRESRDSQIRVTDLWIASLSRSHWYSCSSPCLIWFHSPDGCRTTRARVSSGYWIGQQKPGEVQQSLRTPGFAWVCWCCATQHHQTVCALPVVFNFYIVNSLKRLMAAWPATYMLGKRYLSAYLSSQGALRSMQHGVCAETGMALVSYVWFCRPVTNEYVRLNELARVGLSMLDLRYDLFLFYL